MIGEMTHPDRGFTLKADLVDREPKVEWSTSFNHFKEGDHIVYCPVNPNGWADRRKRLDEYKIGRIKEIGYDKILIENSGSDQEEIHLFGLIKMSILYREQDEMIRRTCGYGNQP